VRDFRPPALIRGPHLQSLLGRAALRRRAVRERAAAMLEVSRQELADCGNGVRLLVQHSPPVGRSRGRVAVLIHGWEGSSDSSYLLASATQLWRAGYRVFRLNLRDHGDSHHLNTELFHSCRLDEVIGAVRWVQSRYPTEMLMLGGFSLGGNFSLRVAADAAAAGLDVGGVAAVCPVLDPVETMYALDDGWLAYRLYFIRKWRSSLERKRRAFPDVYDFGDLGRFTDLQTMTEFFVTNFTEYPDVLSYLRGYAITGDRLSGLTAPSRALLAEDDPVIPIGGLSRLERPAALEIERAEFGGHVGFVADLKLRSRVDDYPLQVFEAIR
jgi:predicted alpha/beta-fold hydrolase